MASKKNTSKTPTPTARPDYWKPSVGDTAVKHEANIKLNDGTIINHDTYIKDGAMYDADSGKILSSNHGVQGTYGDPKEFDKYYDSATGIGTWVQKPKPVQKPSSSSSSSRREESYTPPPRPPFLNFNEPVPSFNSDLKKVNKFTYFSGIDKVEAKRIEINPEVCFVSKTIVIGTLKENEYIELFAKYYADQDASVEFYIIDGEREVPIVPINDTEIKNEKIFFGMDTRFPIDNSAAVLIKQGTKSTNLSFKEASEKTTDSKMENTYSISYTPKTSHKYKPINENVKIKIIMRAYAINDCAPYIKTIKVRKYGGNALWNQDI